MTIFEVAFKFKFSLRTDVLNLTQLVLFVTHLDKDSAVCGISVSFSTQLIAENEHTICCNQHCRKKCVDL